MIRNLFILCSCLFLLSCTKQNSIVGAGSIGEQNRTTAAFKSVHTTADIDAYIKKGNQFSIVLKGYENIIAITETAVENDRLVVRYNNNYHSVNGSNLKAYITMPELNGVGLYGSCMVYVDSFNNSTNLSLNIHGSGNIRVTNSIASNTIAGIYGSGNIIARGLVTNKANVEIHGSGNTEISVNSQLQSNIHGSGNVYYWGSPVVTTNIHGSGRVVKQ